MQRRLTGIHAIVDSVLNEPTLAHHQHEPAFINRVVTDADQLCKLLDELVYDKSYSHDLVELDKKITIYRGCLVKLLKLHENYNTLLMNLYVSHHNLADPSDYEKTLCSFFHAEGVTFRIAQGLEFVLVGLRQPLIQSLLAKALANPVANPTLSTFSKSVVGTILVAHEQEMAIVSDAISASATPHCIPLSQNSTIAPDDLKNLVTLAKLAYTKANATEKLEVLLFFSYYEELLKPVLALRLKEKLNEKSVRITDADIRRVIPSENDAERYHYYADRVNYFLAVINQTLDCTLHNLASIKPMQVDHNNVPDDYPVYVYAKTIDPSFQYITPNDFYALFAKKISGAYKQQLVYFIQEVITYYKEIAPFSDAESHTLSQQLLVYFEKATLIDSISSEKRLRVYDEVKSIAKMQTHSLAANTIYPKLAAAIERQLVIMPSPIEQNRYRSFLTTSSAASGAKESVSLSQSPPKQGFSPQI